MAETGIRVLAVPAPPADLEGAAGMTVETADPGVALDRLDGVDCVVVGHGPDLDGLDLAARVREARPSLPVVIAPADGDEALASRAVEAGLDGYVPAGESAADYVRSAIRDGGPTGILGVDDVETELRLKERAMDEAPVGITISDPGRPDNPLVYVNEAFERVTGYPRGFSIGRNCRFLQGPDTDEAAVAAMAEAIDAEEPVTVEVQNYRQDGAPFWNEVTIAPLRSGGEVTHYVGFQSDVTDRKEAELALERERENLARVLDRVNGLVRDVTEALVAAVSREEIEREVADRMVGADPYDFAWVGRPDIGGDAVHPGAWAGDGSIPEGVEVPLDEGPVARAVESGELQIVRDAAPPGTDRAFGTMAAVPLAYRDAFYGVLCVYAEDDDAIDERETAVLEALGRAIATALGALESKRLIAADEVVELEFSIRSEPFFVDLSARTGCRFEHRGSVYRSDGSLLLFFASEADPEAVRAAVAGYDDVSSVSLLTERDGANLFEFAVPPDAIVATLAERGARTRTMVAEDGEGRLRVELSSEADARAIADLLTERYDAELVAYREDQRPPTTREEFVADLENRLTDRQRAALRKAYVGGYYEWNRSISGDELAASMDISRSTFHQHLRAAERKLVGEFLDRGT